MIESFWQAAPFLGAIGVALLCGFWKFLRAVESNKRRYQNDVSAVRSMVVSVELIPQIVSLIDRVEYERKLDPVASIEKILSRIMTKHVNDIAKSASKTIEVETLYLTMIDKGFRCAYNLLILAPLPVMSIIWLYMFDGNFTQPIIVFSCIIFFYLIAGGITLIFSILEYTGTIRQFINKDNEIRLGLSR